MSTKRIASSTLWQLASQIMMAGLSIITVKLIAIGLTKELAGIYNSAYGFLQFFGIFADFGLYVVAVREVARAKNRDEVFGAIFMIRILVLIIALASALSIVWMIPTWQGTPLPFAVTLAAIVPAFALLAGMLRTIFQIEYKLHFVFIAEVLMRIVTVALMLYYVYALGVRGSSDPFHMYLFLIFGGIGAVVLFLISLGAARRFQSVLPRWNKELMKSFMKSALPFGIAFLCIAAYRNLDITLIALLRGDFEIQNAYYGFVLRISDMGYLIPTYLLNSTLPILSERDEKGEDTSRLLGKTMLIVLILGSVSMLFSVFWARPIMLLLTTEQYLSTATSPGSDTALMLHGIPMFLNGLILYGFYVLLNRHVWKKLVAILLTGTSLSILLNFILIPEFGFVGAAYTSIAVHILLAFLLTFEGVKTMPIHIPLSHIGKWLLFSIGLGLFLWGTPQLLVSELCTVIGLGVATLYMGMLGYLIGLHRIFLPQGN